MSAIAIASEGSKTTKGQKSSKQVKMTKNKAERIIHDFFYEKVSGLSSVKTTSTKVFDHAFCKAIEAMNIQNVAKNKFRNKKSYKPAFHIELDANEKNTIIYNDKKQLAICRY